MMKIFAVRIFFLPRHQGVCGDSIVVAGLYICPGHPRLLFDVHLKDVDSRNKSGRA
jgi:hypothetical protein